MNLLKFLNANKKVKKTKTRLRNNCYIINMVNTTRTIITNLLNPPSLNSVHLCRRYSGTYKHTKAPS